MRHVRDPRQSRLFDPFQGLFSGAALKRISGGWAGAFRHVVLAELPASQLGRRFHETLGAPTKELHAMAGLVFLADFFGWTAEEAADAYLFRLDVQYALNLEPGTEICSRTVERYQRLFREDGLATRVFDGVTTRLVEVLELDVARQRLDSTHVNGHMATFGRTRLMGVAIKRFLTQVKRHAAEEYAALPEEYRRRYEPSESQLFAGAKDAESRGRSRQQAAEDLLWTVERFADRPEHAGRSSYRALVRILAEQCEVVAGKVTVRAKTGGDCLQNPSDPDATYDGHKGPGYHVQIVETCGERNEVQLVVAALPQTACEGDAAAVEPLLEQLRSDERLPEELLTDTAYGSDDNVQRAAALGVELVAPIPGRAPETAEDALTLDDFAGDERTGSVEACPSGHAPQSVVRDEAAGRTRVEMPASACATCPLLALCPVRPTRDGRYELDFTDKDRRLAARRREQATSVFRERYALRSGIESTNSGLKNRLGLDRLRVRGRGSVFRTLRHKLAGWNLLRAAASQKVRARVALCMAAALPTRGTAQTGATSPPPSEPFPVLRRFAPRLPGLRSPPTPLHPAAA